MSNVIHLKMVNPGLEKMECAKATFLFFRSIRFLYQKLCILIHCVLRTLFYDKECTMLIE